MSGLIQKPLRNGFRAFGADCWLIWLPVHLSLWRGDEPKSGSHPRVILPSRGHVAVSGDSFFFFFFCLFRAAPAAYGSFQARGRIRGAAATLCHSLRNTGSEPHLWPTPQLTGNTGSLTHWARPGIKPVSSWILVGFVTIEPRWELPIGSS